MRGLRPHRELGAGGRRGEGGRGGAGLSEEWEDRQLAAWPLLAGSVRDESRRQIAKWGAQRHSPAEWLTILAEEFGELAKEVCELHWAERVTFESREKLYAEAIQLATLALKVAEMGGRPEGF